MTAATNELAKADRDADSAASISVVSSLLWLRSEGLCNIWKYGL